MPAWGSPFDIFFQRLKSVKHHLKIWNKDIFGNIFDNVKKAEDKLLQAQIALEHCWTDGNYTAFNDAKEGLNHTLLMEETFWRQKSGIQWLKEGDKNTRFFHAVASNKFKRSLIRRIKDSNKTWVEDQSTIGALAETYFKNILSSKEHYIDEAIFQVIPKLVTEEDN